MTNCINCGHNEENHAKHSGGICNLFSNKKHCYAVIKVNTFHSWGAWQPTISKWEDKTCSCENFIGNKQ